MFGHSQFASHAADFVLEQPLQRLAQTEVHLLGQTAHIVMALDGLARNVQALDAVGINGALRQPAGIGYLVRFGIEDLDKSRPMILRFCSGSVTPSKSLKNFSLASTPITFSPRHS